MAYRNLRKDDNLSNPEQLGIVKDPNAVISSHSCWKHKMERKLKEPAAKVNPFPQIDYPVRNPKLLKAVSSQIRTLVRKQSLNANANSNNEILTYEDLISNPEILAAMKSEFGIEEIELTNERQNWQGKTIYELLKETKTENSSTTTNDETSDNDKFSTAQSHSPSPPPLQPVVNLTVQHCQLEHQVDSSSLISPPLGFSNEDKSKNAFTTQTFVDDQSTSNLRNQERAESDEHEKNGDDYEGELMECCATTSDQGLLGFLDNPAFLTVCYCLALMHQLGQLGGLDFLSTLGMVLAMISMMSMLFI